MLHILLITILFNFACLAQVQKKTIPIETLDNIMLLENDSAGHLSMIYLGKKLQRTEEYQQISQQYDHQADYSGVLANAYTSAGSTNLVEPAITVTHSDGNNSLNLLYVTEKRQEISDNITLTSILLRDPVYEFEVELFYKAYYSQNVIEQWSVIRHHEKSPVVLQKFASANLYLKGQGFWLKQFHGDWAKEMQTEESLLTHGNKVLDSKLGTRANLYQPPSFMVSINSPAKEDHGEVLLGTLAWTGNFRFDLEIDPLNNLRLITGINNFASAYSLPPSEDFTTPSFIYTYSSQGKGKASRNLQDWARKYRIYNGTGERQTLLNNWEATYFDFDEQRLSKLIADAKKLGVDLFLLDDGWFGNKYPRNNDHAGLGDWQENKKKLPSGIGYLVAQAKKNQVGFGIWIEPEMVNPQSELYQQHPEWIIKQPARPEYYYRNQLVLDLSNAKVQDFVYGVIDTLLSNNAGISYIKWDCNAVIYNAYSATGVNKSHLYIDYVKGFYSVLKKIRERYPAVEMMLCSGGGGRVDYGALQYFNEFWPSDNTDPLERIFMQWEYSYFFPAIATSSHVTDWGKQPLKFKTDVAMMGKLGFDIVVAKLDEKDLAFSKNAVSFYKSQNSVIWHGDQYRLMSPHENPFASMSFVSKDQKQAIMFNYLVSARYGAVTTSPIKLQGLNPSKYYAVKEENLYPGTLSSMAQGKVYSGDFLMQVGLNPILNVKRTSVIISISETDQKLKKK